MFYPSYLLVPAWCLFGVHLWGDWSPRLRVLFSHHTLPLFFLCARLLTMLVPHSTGEAGTRARGANCDVQRSGWRLRGWGGGVECRFGVA